MVNKHEKMSKLFSEQVNAKENHHEMPVHTQLIGIYESMTISKIGENME